MIAYDAATAPTRRRPPTRPEESGEDQRVETTALASHQFHQTFVSRERPLDPATAREVEVMAFKTWSTATDSASGTTVVALCASGPDGRADVLLSGAEARAIALALLRSADDYDRLVAGVPARV